MTPIFLFIFFCCWLLLLFSLCTDSSKIKVHDTNVNLLGDLFYQHHGQPVKWNNLTTCSEGTRRERKKKNQPIWFSARCKFKSEFSQTITIGRLSKTLNPQLYAWIVFCLICVVLWIKNICQKNKCRREHFRAPFPQFCVSLHSGFFLLSFTRQDLFHAKTFAFFNGFQKLVRALGMRKRILYMQNQQSVSHTATCLRGYSAKRDHQTNWKPHRIDSREEIAPEGANGEGKKDRKKRRDMFEVQKKENREGTQAGAICWQRNVSHGEGERARVDEMETGERRREVTGNSRSPACAAFVWFKSN